MTKKGISASTRARTPRSQNKDKVVVEFPGKLRVVELWSRWVISEFEALTGLPVVMNTSFNINGEPIVLSPDDALTTFFNSGLEFLVIGNFLVTKAE